uniref:Uncharacterized protein n=1 Tax=Cacopsylla melanoneura TaxID=428564 RepID=A0A8D8VDM3_9HEMI
MIFIAVDMFTKMEKERGKTPFVSISGVRLASDWFSKKVVPYSSLKNVSAKGYYPIRLQTIFFQSTYTVYSIQVCLLYWLFIEINKQLFNLRFLASVVGRSKNDGTPDSFFVMIIQ